MVKAMKLFPKYAEHGWTPYLWSVWLLWLPVTPFLGNESALNKAFGIIGILVGAPLAWWGYTLRGRRALWVVSAFTLLGLLYAPFNGGACAYFIFAACFIGELAEPRVAFRYLGALLAVIGLESWILRLSPYYWGFTLVASAVMGAALIHYAHQHRLAEKLRQSREEVEHLAKIAERERIARDLHDLLGHTLSVIVLKSELASRLATNDPARAAAEIQDVERISREALAQVRHAVRGYRSAGFDSELQQAVGTLQTAGIRVEMAIENPAMPAAQEGVVALALREAITNVVRHSRAKTCRVSLRQNGSYCELEVADDGRGGLFPEGSGLSGMRERVELLGGALERDGSHGTVLRVRVPV
jgi:two-component system, NarL family, sensor histidine kinase DesK